MTIRLADVAKKYGTSKPEAVKLILEKYPTVKAAAEGEGVSRRSVTKWKKRYVRTRTEYVIPETKNAQDHSE